MRMHTTLVIEVTAHLSAEDGFPLVPYELDGKDRGYSISVSTIDVQYALSQPEGGVFITAVMVHGVRVDHTENGLVYGGLTKWYDLDVHAIHEGVRPVIEKMTAKAAEDWQKIKAGK